MRFEVFQGQSTEKWNAKLGRWVERPGNWYFRIVSGNHQIVAQSEGYTRRNGAERAAGKIAAALYGRLAEVKVLI